MISNEIAHHTQVEQLIKGHIYQLGDHYFSYIHTNSTLSFFLSFLNEFHYKETNL
jgi:hypothetical protein